MISRIAAIVRADVQIRFRRLSTAVVFLLLSGFAYVWVPPPSSGRALMRVAGARVINNSAAISIGTAMLASLFIGLIGYYVVSNAIGRDVRSRCGAVIAATAVRNGEYIVGKFAGNVLFLLTFTAGFMAVSMAMVIVRGEASLEPLTFLAHYALLVPPSIILVSAIAIVFESIPWLSGRLGDVAYFFVWIVMMSVPAALITKGVAGAEYFDFQGFAFVLREFQETQQTQSFAIGAGPFDPKLPAIVLNMMQLDTAKVLGRSLATIVPLALLPIAWVAFHRFDPTRVRSGGRQWSSGWLGRLNQLLKPLTRIAGLFRPRGLVSADAVMTFTARPLAVVALAGLMIASFLAPQSLPIAFAAAAMFIAEVATRDSSAGTTALVYATPNARERFVVSKFFAAAIVATVLLAVPVARLIATRPSAAVSMSIAILFMAAAATAFGVISSSPKTFIVLFLSFWYVVVNDRGATPSIDFAGFYGAQPMMVTLAYAALALLLLAAAEVVHRARLQT